MDSGVDVASSCFSDSSFTSAVQNIYSFELSRDKVSLLYAADTCGSAGEDEVACFEQVELAGIGNDLIDGVNHIPRPAHLARLAIELHLEMQILHIFA